jgi:hypothetical protein
MKNLKFIVAVAFISGSVFTGFSQTGDSVNNNYKEGINQNPTMNDIQNNNNSNPNAEYDFNRVKPSPGLNPPSDFKLNKEDSVAMFNKGGSLINTDTIVPYPIKNP